MSRHLSCTDCYFCGGVVVLEEAPRPITPAEAKCYYEPHHGYAYEGMITAHAHCEDCNAKYLAWISLKSCLGYAAYHGDDEDRCGTRGFFDLSFRSTFNDEPYPEDMPDVQITRKTVVAATDPWPLCPRGCGSKILYLHSPNADYCPVCRDADEKRRKSLVMFGTAREALAELINTVRSNAKSAPWETHPTVTLDRKWLVEFLEKTEKLS